MYTKTVIKVFSFFLVCGICICLFSLPAYALSWTCPNCGQTFNFASSDSAHRNNFAQRHSAACGSSSSSGGGYGGYGSYGSSGDPYFDAMMPVMEMFFNAMGQELANSLFGNPEQERRAREQRALEAQRREEEQRRLEEERRRREEERRLRLQAIQQKMLSDMMFLQDGGTLDLMGTDQKPLELNLMGFESQGSLELMGMDDTSTVDLRPQGTSFFGLGGGDAQGMNDPNVVDLRHLQQGVYLAQAAAQSTTDDAQFLMEEALNATQGKQVSVSIPHDAIPVIDEKGLLEFQTMNNEYRTAKDSHMYFSDRSILADERYKKAAFMYQKAKEALDQASADPSIDMETQKQRLAEVYESLKKLHETREQVRAELTAAQCEVSWKREMVEEKIRSLAIKAPPSPIGHILATEREETKPPIAERVLHQGLARFNKKYGDEQDKIFVNEYGVYQDPDLEDELKGIIDQIKLVSPYPNEDIPFKILDSSGPGKYSFGAQASTSTIYYDSEYLKELQKKYKGDPKMMRDELTVVTAHELAHIQNDHVIKGFVRAKATSVIDLKDFILQPYHSDEEKNDMYVELARKVQFRGYMREQEEEADRNGVQYALASGVSKQAVKNMFDDMMPSEKRRLQKRAQWVKTDPDYNPTDMQIDKMFETHPRTAERLEKIEKIWGKEFWKK
ncbi:MAG: M48 family metalloprotease [Candidatus Omnitrophica bacterium]|nr:M48 family metalloprotease [Candidatus Omnitrophota bacterium]